MSCTGGLVGGRQTMAEQKGISILMRGYKHF